MLGCYGPRLFKWEAKNLEIKASTPMEVEHPSPCKKRKLDLIDENECENLDRNFSNDSHLLISLSVLLTPEDNPQGNQEKQFEADFQEQSQQKLLMKHHRL